jgi:adenylate cyclase
MDRKLENILEVQDEISLLIADKLREQLGHFEIKEHLVESRRANPDAYNYSLRHAIILINGIPMM